MPKFLHTACGMPIPVSDEEYAEVMGDFGADDVQQAYQELVDGHNRVPDITAANSPLFHTSNLVYNGTADQPYAATNPSVKTCDLCKRPRDNMHHSLCAVCLYEQRSPDEADRSSSAISTTPQERNEAVSITSTPH